MYKDIRQDAFSTDYLNALHSKDQVKVPMHPTPVGSYIVDHWQ